MSYSDADARGRLLDALAAATDELARALAAVGAAYELLDEQQADRLEADLFRPLQRAYGRAKRTHAEFAAAHGLPGRDFATPAPGAPSTGVKGFVGEAAEAAGRADAEIAELQDSLLPVEVGDPAVRAGLAETRELIANVGAAARGFVRTFGR